MRTIPSTALYAAAVCCTLLASACRTVYAPNTVNTPLLDREGEVRATIDVGNLQVAYALTNSIGLMANAYYHNSSGNDEDALNKGIDLNGSGYLVEAGAGYYSREGGNLILEGYGGIGFGGVSINEKQSSGSSATDRFDANGVKLFLQPGIGLAGKVVELSVASRITAVKYMGLRSENYTESELNDYHLRDLDGNLWMFLEPALTMRVGYKAVKAQMQVGVALKLNNSPLNYSTTILNVGLSVLLGGQ